MNIWVYLISGVNTGVGGSDDGGISTVVQRFVMR